MSDNVQMVLIVSCVVGLLLCLGTFERLYKFRTITKNERSPKESFDLYAGPTLMTKEQGNRNA